jgi:ribonucleoside-diphosphate reductase alpha chain
MNNEYRWLTDLSRQFLERDYLVDGQTVEERVDVICDTAERILKKPGFANAFKDNLKKGWYSLSSPIWANFGTARGLPISCFGSMIEDTMESILYTHAEVGMMTKHGGGTSAYFGKLRGRGESIRQNGQSSGSVHFMSLFENLINIVSQGTTRRGNFAAYLPIDHKDIVEFIGIRNEGHMIQDLSFGVCVSDDWMQSMVDGDKDKRVIWAKVLESRANKGYPYIFFTDNVNKNKPDCYKDLLITHSNLCTEIMLPDSEDESFVCDLSSMNLLYFDEWKDTNAVEILTYFLDAVMTEFIKKGKKVEFMSRPVRFAERHRALGIGWLGYHSYLQSKMIPFESMEAKYANVTIAKNIKEAAYKASAKLAQEYGEPEVLKGYGRRNSTLLAIAPTKSSAFIMGQVSENTEPNRTNIVIKDLQKGKYTMKNIYLEQLLESKGKNDESTWSNILKNGGSVQPLDFLTKHEKDVFKTFSEITPKEIIIQAAQRQKYIDQGQSLNIMIHPSIPIKDVNSLIIEGWKMGIKSFYYQYSVNAAQAFARDILACQSCQA